MTMKRLTTAAIFSALLLFQLFFAAAAWAQMPSPSPDSGSSPPAAAKTEKDPFGRETPQGMVAGLMNALAAGDYDRALNYFATDSVQGERSWYVLSGPMLVRRFQEVLDRAGTVVTPAELSNEADGRVNDGLAPNVERFGVVKLPDAEVPLLAEQATRDGRRLWLVSEGTLKQIPALVQSAESRSNLGGLISYIPEGPNIAGARASQWFVLLIVGAFSLVLAWLLAALHGPIVRYFWPAGTDSAVSGFIKTSVAPGRLLLALILFGIAVQAIEISVVARYRALFLAQVLAWFAVTWLLWRWADVAGKVILDQMSRRGQLTAYSALSFFKRAVKVLLAIVFVAALLRAFGFNVTAGLAALGVGGLAIALGAQKLFENLIGGMTLIVDHPVRIGDFCRFGNNMGTIEEIGIRSTRIRTLDRTILTVPNGEFAALHIENFSHRDRFWFHPVLNLRYETSSSQIRDVLDGLRKVLADHPSVASDSPRVRLIGLSASSLDIEIFAYVYARDQSHFLEIQEGLLLSCMEIVESSGTGFAFPSQTLYLGRDRGVKESPRREFEATTSSGRADKS
jgi:MscS family membrane protein